VKEPQEAQEQPAITSQRIMLLSAAITVECSATEAVAAHTKGHALLARLHDVVEVTATSKGTAVVLLAIWQLPLLLAVVHHQLDSLTGLAAHPLRSTDHPTHHPASLTYAS
jgi:hypothetical protein